MEEAALDPEDLQSVDYYHFSDHPHPDDVSSAPSIDIDFQNRSISDVNLNFTHNDGSSATACVVLAFVSIFLNLYVIGILIRNKEKVFKNVFYLLVLHCSFVDFVRALSLILWFLPELDWFEMDPDALLEFMKVKQILVIKMRSLNMLTILNLLMFTFNEFIVVKRPLHYRRIVRQRIILVLLGCSWAICFLFGLCSVMTRHVSEHGPRIHQNLTVEGHHHVSRRQRTESEESIQSVFIFAIVVVCGLCMLLVFTCYTQVMLRVRQFQQFDTLKTLQEAHEGLRFRGSISSGCLELKQRRLQILIRHKYLLVIGLVVLIDVIFLVPYCVIQILQFVHLSNQGQNPGLSQSWTRSRWISHLLIALHACLQPLCYFRMEEFRRLAFCQRAAATIGAEGGAKAMNKMGESEEHLAALTEDDREILAMSEMPQVEVVPLKDFEHR